MDFCFRGDNYITKKVKVLSCSMVVDVALINVWKTFGCEIKKKKKKKKKKKTRKKHLRHCQDWDSSDV